MAFRSYFIAKGTVSPNTEAYTVFQIVKRVGLQLNKHLGFNFSVKIFACVSHVC